ncbi:MAG: NAD(P)/FAD-dependent oxidoreductase [Gemmatimonadetes bacterium]|nr:NAD(P)/FAD-dependent oxidoreductase [Gemmatimonadota bacterium]
MKSVVVIGGGFAGLNCVRNLASSPVDITLIDRRNFHLFQPLLYQVATASLSPGDIASPLRAILRRKKNVRVWMADVRGIDVDRRFVQLEDGEVAYDYLVVAAGATHGFFGHPEWERHSLGLKTVEDALEMRRRFLVAFEAAERTGDPNERRRLLTFVIVGAGPTGVELAGAMAEISRDVMPADFRAIDTKSARVLLLEGGDRVLPAFAPELSARAQRALEVRGVEVRTGALVTAMGPGHVMVGEERIEACNVIWAAGVQASPLGAALNAPVDRAGRVRILPDCSIPGHPEVFVIGDLAAVQQNGKPVPGVAPAAIQMGRHAADAIRRDLQGQPRKPFRYLDKGILATIGRAAAVGEIFGLKVWGFIAWLGWSLIHVAYLIGFRNRLLVMIQWGWSWVRWTGGIRLITQGNGGEKGPAR